MSSKRIEQSIDDIYEFIEMCKPKGFSNNLIIVPKDELLEKLDEMKLRVPEEVTRCAEFLKKRDEKIKEAEAEAQRIVEEAKQRAEGLVSESEVMRQAYLQANEFISRTNRQVNDAVAAAAAEANEIREGAYAYTKEMLASIESVLTNAYNETKAKSDEYLETLFNNLEMVTANRKELLEEIAPEEEKAPSYKEEELSDSQFFGTDHSEEDDEFDNPDSDRFLNDIE